MPSGQDVDAGAGRAQQHGVPPPSAGREPDRKAGGDGEGAAAVDGRYRSDRVIGFGYLPTGNSGDDLTIDASLSFVPYDRGFTATVFVRNLTNEAMRSLYQVGAANVAGVTLEPPRTYGIRLGYKF